MSTGRDDGALVRLLTEHQIPFVVIGGWAVIAHGYVRATKDIDFLVPDCPAVRSSVARALAAVRARTFAGQTISPESAMPDQGWQVQTDLGRIDILLEGLPPLDFASVQAGAVESRLNGQPALVAGLTHLVAFKRLAGRPQDDLDLAELTALHGPLPVLTIPGVD